MNFFKKIMNQKNRVLFLLNFILKALLKALEMYDIFLNSLTKGFCYLAQKLELHAKKIINKMPKIDLQTKKYKTSFFSILEKIRSASPTFSLIKARLKSLWVKVKIWTTRGFIFLGTSAKNTYTSSLQFSSLILPYLKKTTFNCALKTTAGFFFLKNESSKIFGKCYLGLKIITRKWVVFIHKIKVFSTQLKNSFLSTLKKLFWFSKAALNQSIFYFNLFLKKAYKHYLQLQRQFCTLKKIISDRSQKAWFLLLNLAAKGRYYYKNFFEKFIVLLLSIIIVKLVTGASKVLDHFKPLVKLIYSKNLITFAHLFTKARQVFFYSFYTLGQLKNNLTKSIKKNTLNLVQGTKTITAQCLNLTKRFTLNIFNKTLSIILMLCLKVKNIFYNTHALSLSFIKKTKNFIFHIFSSVFTAFKKTLLTLKQSLTFLTKRKKTSKIEINDSQFEVNEKSQTTTDEKALPRKKYFDFSAIKTFFLKLKVILNPKNISLPKAPSMGLPGFMNFDLLSTLKSFSLNLKLKLKSCFAIKLDKEKIPLGKRLFFTASFFFITITFLKSFGLLSSNNRINFIQSTESSGLESIVNANILINGIFFKKKTVVIDSNIKFSIENGSESLDNIDDFSIENSLKTEKKLLGSYSNLKNSILNYSVKFELPTNNISRDVFPFAEKELFFVLKNNSVLTQEMVYSIQLKDFNINLNGLNAMTLHSKHITKGKAIENSLVGNHILEYPAMAFLFSLKQSPSYSFLIMILTILPLIVLLLGLLARLKAQAMLTLTFASSIGLFFLNMILQKKFNLESNIFSYYQQALMLTTFFIVISWVYFIVELCEKIINLHILKSGYKARNALFATGSLSIILLSFFWILPAFF